jgi:hypothetical protein
MQATIDSLKTLLKTVNLHNALLNLTFLKYTLLKNFIKAILQQLYAIYNSIKK